MTLFSFETFAMLAKTFAAAQLCTLSENRCVDGYIKVEKYKKKGLIKDKVVRRVQDIRV